MLQQGQLVVLESTTYPGTTREQVAPILEQSGRHRRRRHRPQGDRLREVVEKAPLVIDFRGVTRGLPATANLVRL